MQNGSCEVSVVISTYNRSEQLEQALRALARQVGDVLHEVIVVDNNSTDETSGVVRSWMSRMPHLRLEHEPQQGLPYARNTGVLAANAPIVAFTDDDVEVGPEWVATIKRVFDAHPDVDAIGGRIRPRWPADMPTWFTPRQLGPFALGERGDAPIRVSAANAAPCLVGANFACRRAVFDRIGLFDTAYLKSQDREIQLRLWRAGGVGLYAPELVATVHVPPERMTKRYYRYWYTTYGTYHSRMRLLDSIDRHGRLGDHDGPRWFGAPAYLYRGLLRSLFRFVASTVRGRRADAFYWENRLRYVLAYLVERYRVRSSRTPNPGPRTSGLLQRAPGSRPERPAA